ncbi:MAG TPA: hypothetical protein VMR76_01030 [Candidatus Saccharimonadia bacterium]|nr:hypothetical protein [Candidatus Saccharimonadia bacterium]
MSERVTKQLEIGSTEYNNSVVTSFLNSFLVASEQSVLSHRIDVPTTESLGSHITTDRIIKFKRTALKDLLTRTLEANADLLVVSGLGADDAFGGILDCAISSIGLVKVEEDRDLSTVLNIFRVISRAQV